MDGFIKIRRGLIDHIRAGRLSNDAIAVYLHLLFCADFSTGLQKNSAPHIYYSMGQRSTLRCIQRALEQLEKAGYIKRFRIPGKKKDYHLIIDKYEVTSGVLTGSRVDASSTTHYGDIQYTPGTDEGTDGRADSGTEDALELTGPSFCTTVSERVYITAMDCESWLGRSQGLEAAGAGGL